MGETIGMSISVLVIAGFVIYMLLFFLTWASEALIDHNERKELERQRQERLRREMEEADNKKIKEAHKVRTQYPPPEQKVTSFEITNTKDSIIVTETVYAD